MEHRRNDGEHLSDDQIIEYAMSRSGDERSAGSSHATHVDTCQQCQAEVAEYRRVLDAIRSPIPLQPADPGAGRSSRSESAPAEVVPLPLQRRKTITLVAAAAAVGSIIGGGVVAAVAQLWPEQEPEPPVAEETEPPPTEEPEEPVDIGSALLEAATDDGIEGEAVMHQDADGTLLLTIEVSDVPPEGYQEVWLRDAEAENLISLGTLSGHTADLPVPSGIDLDQFPIVDVSQEHFDGDPGHSGVTLTAGPMEQ